MMEKRSFDPRDMQKKYARVSRIYNSWARLTESKAAERVLALAQIHAGEHILEVALGTGMVFEQIVSRNASGGNYGIDLSPGMLFKARRRLGASAPGNYALQLASVYHLPFKSQKFDLIVNSFMFDLLPEDDFEPILSEMKRVLKPGGRVLISTMTFGTKWYHHAWLFIAKHFPALLTGCRPISLGEFLTGAGFEITHAELISQNTFPSEVIRAEIK